MGVVDYQWLAVIASDYEPHSGAASRWQRATRYVLIFKCGSESSLLLGVRFVLSTSAYESPPHLGYWRRAIEWLPIPVHATYDMVTQEAFTVASEKSARGATLASWQQSHGSGGIVLMS